MKPRCSNVCWTLLLATAVVASCMLIVPGRTVAADNTSSNACIAMLEKSQTQFEQLQPGVYVQRFTKTDVTGGLAGLPDRVTTDLEPGAQGHICIGYHNRTGQQITLRFGTTDFTASDSGSPVPVASSTDQYGAGSWLKLPTQGPVSLEHGDLVWLDVKVNVPADAAGGSTYAGVAGLMDGDIDAEEDAQARISPSVVVEVFFDVPGDITQGGKIIDVRSPRVVWWDGFNFGKLPVLERLRGSGLAAFRWRWKNTGSVTDEIVGSVRINSSLGGRSITSIKVPERIVMRDSARDVEAYWSDDIPFIGRFTPTIELTDAQGKHHTRQLPAVWVIPSWWYLLALAIAIAVPLWLRRRSKRRYNELLARIEAAEMGGEEDSWAEDDDF